MNKEKITASSVNKFIRENAPRSRLWDSELGGFIYFHLPMDAELGVSNIEA